MNRKDIGENQKKIRKIADRMLIPQSEWEMNIEHFDWVPGVGLYGLYRAYEATGEEKYLKFLEEWTKRHLQEAYIQKTVNSTAPLLSILCLYEKKKDPILLKVCEEIAEDILRNAPRTVDGGLEHTVTEPVEGFSDQVWADTLFMVCIFLAKLSSVTGKECYSAFAKEQLQIHLRLLKGTNGLYYHGYNGARKDHMSSIHWGRANGWILYSTAQILTYLPDPEEKERIREQMEDFVKALKMVQEENGGFHTILDDRTSYLETSATALIGAGLWQLLSQKKIGEEYREMARLAVEYVRGTIEEDGLVQGVSTGTPVMPDREGYKGISLRPTLYGQGAAILALAEENADKKLERKEKEVNGFYL